MRAKRRRLPIGAEVLPGGVHFRVWAPRCRRVTLLSEGAAEIDLESEGNGYFSILSPDAANGSLYRYRLNGDEGPFPDPASRFQPDGPHGPSMVVDPGTFDWSDSGWRGLSLGGRVIYEMHIGTFTPEGTFAAATRELPELAELGVSVLEVMPVADFPGRFGWGYDGVNLFAPTRLYGRPDDLRRFINEAHRLEMAVILDVVYNHLGPDGNYLTHFSEDYFTDRYDNEWGDPLNFDGPNSGPVREYFVSNAGYWIDEYHFDGLRLDATQSIPDASSEHILAAISRRVKESAKNRSTLLIAENESQNVRLLKPLDCGGYGIDALWNDDFHHSSVVALTGRADAYYSDHRGRPQEFISAVKHGFLFQGQHYSWQNHARGTPAFGLKPSSFVLYIENHDQVANSLFGRRCHYLSSPGRIRAMTALLLLAPGTPMLFQGQEFAASSPFMYFADHKPELASLVRKGRTEFLRQFPAIAAESSASFLPDPFDSETFEKSKLDLSERHTHSEAYSLHKDLIRLRRTDPTFARQGADGIDGAVLDGEAFLLRFFSSEGEDRLLLINLGPDLRLHVQPEPLLAPVAGTRWEILWSSEHPSYGAGGVTEVLRAGTWYIPGHAAVALKPLRSQTATQEP